MVEEKIAKRSKDKFFRGKNTADLVSLDTREFAKLVKSRARRSLLRKYDVIEAFVKKCEVKAQKGKIPKTHNRALVVVPKMVGKTIGVYDGKEFIKVIISEDMLGHRLGEFAMTRKIAKHTTLGKKKESPSA
jgi:small subunit ribosomal protein S19